MRKALAVLATIIMSFAAVGCFKHDGGRKIDPNKTQLYIGNFNGGMGSAWLQEVADAFEAEHPDVEVLIDNKKEQFNGTMLLDTIKTNRQDIYFTTEVLYDDAVARELFADITDVVTEKAEERDGEMISIEDKMIDQAKQYLQRDGKYYAVPFFTTPNGIVYDVDLFEKESLYFKEGGGWTRNKQEAAAGPDGIPGNEDDGLPSTWEEFKELLSRMRQTNRITPFTWSGANVYYRLAPLTALWANYEGYNNFVLNYTFKGTDTKLGPIDNTNGYLLQQQVGKKAALTFAADIAGEPENYSANAFYSSQTHTAAQREYLTSAVNGGKRIAMLLDGGWWENEARDAGVFDYTATKDAQLAYGVRKFGYMPFPRFIGTDGIDDQTSTRRTMYTDTNSFVFISANSAKIDLAKEFLQFSTSDVALRTCTRVTGVPRPYDYELTADDKEEMTPYANSVWEYFHDENTDIVISYVMSDLRRENSGYFSNWLWSTTVDGKTYTDPLFSFSNPDDDITPAEYFESFRSYYNAETWANLIQ